MRSDKIPTIAERWLRRVRIASASLSRPQRRELVDGLRAHIADALESGEDLELTLFRLGSPEAVADEAEESLERPNAPQARKWVLDMPRALSLTAQALALIGLLLVAVWPTGEVALQSDGAAVFITLIGPMSVVFWSGAFLLPMLLGIIGATAGVAARRARLLWTYIAAAVVLIAAVIAVVLGNVLLVPSAAAAIVAALSLRARSARRIHSTRGVA